jgi:large subunit ribosomal protein L4
VICEDGMQLPIPKGLGKNSVKRSFEQQFIQSVFEFHNWGKGKGKSLLITNEVNEELEDSLKRAEVLGRVQCAEDVDVKDLLQLARVVVEKSALERMLREHQSDLEARVKSAVY